MRPFWNARRGSCDVSVTALRQECARPRESRNLSTERPKGLRRRRGIPTLAECSSGFTEDARQVVVFAQDDARELGHNSIGTEHLLLGLLRQGDGIGGQVLAALGITLESARAACTG